MGGRRELIPAARQPRASQGEKSLREQAGTARTSWNGRPRNVRRKGQTRFSENVGARLGRKHDVLQAEVKSRAEKQRRDFWKGETGKQRESVPSKSGGSDSRIRQADVEGAGKHQGKWSVMM